MLKTHRLDEYKCPYAVFISKALDKFGMDTSNEVREFTRDVHFVKDRALKIIKLIKTDEGWLTKEELQAEDEDESVEPKVLTAFKDMILKQMGELRASQEREFREIKDSLESILERLYLLDVPFLGP
ncbi:hypothetical protein VNO78_00657 [Psophocarpus tetragonolobus]|uniref:Uncharacterized protein n=1 Tax=Psophocarpus tetragonolobus TaxID=3891 RepID=A0AAN9SXB1_PSOTE